MKYEDIKKLKAGDKLVIELSANDVYGSNEILPYNAEAELFLLQLYKTQFLGKVSDFQQEKIKFTKAEKEEFDAELPKLYGKDDDFEDIQEILNLIDGFKKDFPALNQYLYNGPADKNFENQIKFVKAIDNPDLIEVEKEKRYRLKVLDSYVCHDVENDMYWFGEKHVNLGIENMFVESEISKIQKLPQFQSIDLGKCKEAVE